MKCAGCGTEHKRADMHLWSVRPCALKPKRFRNRYLCTPCDVKLNEIIVHHLFGSTRDGELAAYREKMGL